MKVSHKGFRATDLNSMVNTRMVTNVAARWMDTQTHAQRDRKLALYTSSDDAVYLYKVL